jgi:16S rRNA (guanine527-N7)-methyltransferase
MNEKNFGLPAHFIQNSQLQQNDPRIKTLSAFLDRLLHVNQTVNLTAIREPDEAWNRHILEAIALAQIDSVSGQILDLGSGGGLPGIPLAIMRTDLRVILLEATGKKADFLSTTVAALDLPHVEVLHARAEEAGHNPEHRERYDGVVCRAVGSLSEIIELSLPLLRPQGLLYAIKGRRATQELDEAAAALEQLHGRTVSQQPLLPGVPDNDSVLTTIEKTKTTDHIYPRRNGLPKKRPL